MRTYVGHNPQAIQDVATRNAVLALHDQMLQLNGGVPNAAAYPTGTVIVRGPGGSGGGGVTVHADLDGLTADDHTQYVINDGSRGTQQIVGRVDLVNTDGDVANTHGLTLNTSSKYIQAAETSGSNQYYTWIDGGGGVNHQLYQSGVKREHYKILAGTGIVVNTWDGSSNFLADHLLYDEGLYLDANVDTTPLFIQAHTTQTSPLTRWRGNLVDVASMSGAGELMVADGIKFDTTPGGSYVKLTAPSSVSTYTITLPAGVPGSVGEVLVDTDGAGTLGWGATSPTALLDSSAHTDTFSYSPPTQGAIVYCRSVGAGPADKYWDGLAVGTNNQVLTTDGTDVMWGSLDKSHLADRTRHFFIHPSAFYAGTGTNFHLTPGSNPNAANALAFSGTADSYFYTNVMWPADMASGSGITYKIYFIQRGGSSANSIIWYMYQLKPVVGTTLTSAAYDKLDKATHSTNSGTDVVTTVTITSTLVSPAAGDFVRLTLARLASTDGSDNNTNTVDLLGVKVEYTADM